MGTEATSQSESASEYGRVRLYESSDRDDFLSLYESVWGRHKSADWFDWRFDANPYRDGVQMVVAEREGELVGAEPLLPFRLRAGSTTIDAYQPVDWIVHADHRRRGLFTRMTERLLAAYTDADLFFNFPTDVLRPGLAKFDWQAVGEVPMSYRVHDPRHLRDESASNGARLADAALSVGGTATRLGASVLDRLNAPSSDVTVDRHEEVPVETLVELYTAAVPQRLHVTRDEQFLRWRFANPNWDTTTYVASKGGRPVASVVAARERLDGFTCTHLLDVQPMVTSALETGAFAALLSAVVADHRDADLLKAPANVHPDLLRRFLFFEDTAFPLSRVTTTSTQVVRPLSIDSGGAVPRENGASRGDGGDDPWQVAGLDLTDPESWHLTLADVDIE